MLKVHSTLHVPSDQQAINLSEWGQNMMLISIVRMFAGKKWSPIEMSFQSRLPIGNYAREKFPDTRFLTAQKSAWIAIPVSLLSLPPKTQTQPLPGFKASHDTANQLIHRLLLQCVAIEELTILRME